MTPTLAASSAMLVEAALPAAGAGAPVLFAAGAVPAVALMLRGALIELRWWWALRDTSPAERPEIIRALHGTRRTPLSRRTRSEDP
ncbi:hypothetical protein [Pseudonocardia hydrocarbonoxydans]|uniref:hypothetical protein n=1 Tax=Pseudonocardia hydrocarbonoxydans TaxID=76726 RepID=UPI0031DDA40B